MLIVATEQNEVAALAADHGQAIWRRTLGTPVPLSILLCGDISPVGVTGTPVIDETAGAIYLDALVLKRGEVRHEVFGLSLADGSVLPGWPVDVAQGLAAEGISLQSRLQLQRGALALVDGRLFVAFGGNPGDCGPYRGIVAALDTVHPSVVAGWVTRALRGGIWSEGGVVSDGHSIFVATGNTFRTKSWKDGEAVIRLRPDLQHTEATQDYFVPASWFDLDRRDEDLGSTAPLPIDLPLPGGGTAHWLVQLGKDGIAYVLDRSNLGGIGGQLFHHVATSIDQYAPIAGAPAVYPSAGGANITFGTFDAFRLRLWTIHIAANPNPVITQVWNVPPHGSLAPIVTTTDGTSDPVVWVVGTRFHDPVLHAYRGDNGSTLYDGTDLLRVQRSTPIVGDGRLYIAGNGRVYAFGFTPPPN